METEQGDESIYEIEEDDKDDGRLVIYRRNLFNRETLKVIGTRFLLSEKGVTNLERKKTSINLLALN